MDMDTIHVADLVGCRKLLTQGLLADVPRTGMDHLNVNRTRFQMNRAEAVSAFSNTPESCRRLLGQIENY